MQNKNQSILSNFFWIIIIILVSIVFYNNSFSYSFKKNENGNIINTVLEEIQKNYVDSVDIDSLIERSIRQILTNLDPHSIYMNSDEVSSSFEMMQGSFEGIGIEFSIHQDTIIIVIVIVLAFVWYIRKKLRKYRSVWRDLLRVIKINVDFLQITSAVPELIHISWPPVFNEFLVYFDFVNADFLSLTGASCVNGVNFNMKFTLLFNRKV